MQELAVEQSRPWMKGLHISQMNLGRAAEGYGSQSQSLRYNSLVLRAAGFGEAGALNVAAASAADDSGMRVSWKSQPKHAKRLLHSSSFWLSPRFSKLMPAPHLQGLHLLKKTPDLVLAAHWDIPNIYAPSTASPA